ncbi:1,5-anhydro-D-fructose reductase [Defluviimonas aquaemixtae]|uniref:1,5-anhydro-D-fructose reductase n=1 Tax=Albidovulum aquaemixtae TaxID=1542388 RepID=A0A2R8B236_9RHOB|nr:Gfo/Idh/MocA family oxidoreductase [Defluviimonas aquaemixtae]SPH16605.1 1,5-anhydro-D-fructose reductase [Defluviimonas aquaemixtae]
MSGAFRLGLVGAGAIARSYAAAISGGGTAQLVAVADTDGDAAAAFARDTGAVPFSSHRDLAAASICDAVLVTTPPATHAAIVIDLVSRGLPVLCEKPLSITLDSARQMTQAAADNGVVLSMASKFRFVDDVIRAREMIAEGAIGAPLMLENVFTSVVDMTNRWNADARISGGGVLIDNGTHSIDIVRYFLGPITEVFAVAGPRMQPVGVEDTVTLIARTAGGAQTTVETSWSLHKDRSAFIAVYGTEGAIEVGWQGSRFRRGRAGIWEPYGTGYDKSAAFARQIDHFAAVVRGEDKPLPDAADALASVAVIQAAYRSIATGRWVPAEPDLAHSPFMEIAR